MYEVEVKARIRNRDSVVKKLQSLGCEFSEEMRQIDKIFVPKGTPLPRVPLGTTVLRVRKQNNKYFFTLKIPQSNQQDCIEREIEIKDGEGMIKIMELMKWDQFATVEKIRVKTNMNDMEIALDVVQGLGDFIEAEKILENDDPEERKKVQEALFDFLETLGISKEDRVIDGKYDVMLYEKLNH